MGLIPGRIHAAVNPGLQRGWLASSHLGVCTPSRKWFRVAVILTILTCGCAAPSSAADREIVYGAQSGQVITRSDLAPLTGKLSREVVWWDQPVPPEAEEQHQAGRDAGAVGDYEQAFAALAEAYRLAPDWPYPLYDAASICLLIDDLDQAIALYEQVAVLAPRGFHDTTTALDTLRRERAGVLPRGSY
jgi:hypothetical protein